MTERLTKQQLKEDPLLNKTAEAADFLTTHGRLLAGAVLAIAVIAAVVLFVRMGSARSEDRAAGMLAEARADYSRGALDAAAARLEDIANTAGGTRAGKMSTLLYGDVRFAQSRYDEALTHYRQGLDAFKRDALLSDAARQGLAACYENLSQYDEASKLYVELAESAPNGVIKAELLMAVARNYLKAGRQEEAVKIYTDLSSDQDNPRVAQDAKLRLAEILAVRAG